MAGRGCRQTDFTNCDPFSVKTRSLKKSSVLGCFFFNQTSGYPFQNINIEQIIIISYQAMVKIGMPSLTRFMH